MSTKTELLASMKRASAKKGGAHLTRKARDGVCERVAEHLHGAGFRHLREVEDMALRHVRSYIAARKAQAVSVRSMQNDMAHLRGLLAVAGKVQLLKEAGMTNAALGIAGASRIGTKTAMTEDAYAALREAIKDDGLRAMVGMERYLGLRAMEAIRSRDRLIVWERQLAQGQTAIEVVLGTKGGKPRTTHLPNPEQALAVVREALAVLQNQHRLAKGKNLKQAGTWYRNAMHRLGVQGHALRYAFVRERVDAYLQNGIPMAEALARTSMDLGHGDGRGRWVKSVYLR